MSHRSCLDHINTCDEPNVLMWSSKDFTQKVLAAYYAYNWTFLKFWKIWISVMINVCFLIIEKLYKERYVYTWALCQPSRSKKNCHIECLTMTILVFLSNEIINSTGQITRQINYGFCIFEFIRTTAQLCLPSCHLTHQLRMAHRFTKIHWNNQLYTPQ